MRSPALPPHGEAPPDGPRVSPLPQDSVYIFQEGALPPYRQMFYQLCDLNVEEYVLEGCEARVGPWEGVRAANLLGHRDPSQQPRCCLESPLSGSPWATPQCPRQGAGLATNVLPPLPTCGLMMWLPVLQNQLEPQKPSIWLLIVMLRNRGGAPGAAAGPVNPA